MYVFRGNRLHRLNDYVQIWSVQVFTLDRVVVVLFTRLALRDRSSDSVHVDDLTIGELEILRCRSLSHLFTVTNEHIIPGVNDKEDHGDNDEHILHPVRINPGCQREDEDGCEAKFDYNETNEAIGNNLVLMSAIPSRSNDRTQTHLGVCIC